MYANGAVTSSGKKALGNSHITVQTEVSKHSFTLGTIRVTTNSDLQICVSQYGYGLSNAQSQTKDRVTHMGRPNPLPLSCCACAMDYCDLDPAGNSNDALSVVLHCRNAT